LGVTIASPGDYDNQKKKKNEVKGILDRDITKSNIDILIYI